VARETWGTPPFPLSFTVAGRRGEKRTRTLRYISKH
jgi:hypothetical protein